MDAFYFTVYKDGIFTFKPLLNQTEANITYNIKIVLKDYNLIYPKLSRYILSVFLLGSPASLAETLFSNKTVPVTNSTI